MSGIHRNRQQLYVIEGDPIEQQLLSSVVGLPVVQEHPPKDVLWIKSTAN